MLITINIITVFVLIISWYTIGWLGFIFWWTFDFDFRSNDIWIAVIVGAMGPLSWVTGFIAHYGIPAARGRSNMPGNIIFRRRT